MDSYVDAEVSGSAVQRPAGSQGFGEVLQGEGRGEDPHGETEHQETCGASERPAVSWMDVRLQEDSRAAFIRCEQSVDACVH